MHCHCHYPCHNHTIYFITFFSQKLSNFLTLTKPCLSPSILLYSQRFYHQNVPRDLPNTLVPLSPPHSQYPSPDPPPQPPHRPRDTPALLHHAGPAQPWDPRADPLNRARGARGGGKRMLGCVAVAGGVATVAVAVAVGKCGCFGIKMSDFGALLAEI
jgi:hypothetical protein